MGRMIVAVVAGLLCAGFTVGVVEAVGHWVYPPPPGLDIGDPAQLRSIMGRLPTGALVFVIVAWTVGALVGGFVAARLARRHPERCAMTVGGVMVVFVGINIVMIPHPAWMVLLALALPIPTARLGGRLASDLRVTREHPD